MRIIAGHWRGRKLVAPQGQATRPTADRVREALFSMLASRLGSFDELCVADLFAGSGAIGLEALSRGAAHCTFVENDRTALGALEANIEKLGAAASVLARSAVAPGKAARPCDLVFLDPPYGQSLAAPALAALRDQGWLTPSSWISLETGRDETVAHEGFACETDRAIGKAQIWLLRPA